MKLHITELGHEGLYTVWYERPTWLEGGFCGRKFEVWTEQRLRELGLTKKLPRGQRIVVATLTLK